MKACCIFVASVTLIAIPNRAVAEWHFIPPAAIDLSPALGVPPDGIPEYWCNAALDAPQLSATPFPFGYGYHVTVSNLLPDPLVDATLTVQNLQPYFGFSPPFIHLYDLVWNPGALAGGSIPAYPLGLIPPNGSQSVDVNMLRGFEIPFPPDFHVLIVTPEPSTFALLGVGAISLLAYAWRRWRRERPAA